MKEKVLLLLRSGVYKRGGNESKTAGLRLGGKKRLHVKKQVEEGKGG